MASKIYWTRQACDDLRAIRDHIARDAPATAAAFVRRLHSLGLQGPQDQEEDLQTIGRVSLAVLTNTHQNRYGERARNAIPNVNRLRLPTHLCHRSTQVRRIAGRGRRAVAKVYGSRA